MSNETLIKIIGIYIIVIIIIAILKRLIMKLIKETKVSNNLRKYRVYKNKTQEEMADVLGISNTLYRKIELHMQYPGIIVRRKILNYFNVNHDQMFNS